MTGWRYLRTVRWLDHHWTILTKDPEPRWQHFFVPMCLIIAFCLAILLWWR